jgi:DNA gyrase subunit A
VRATGRATMGVRGIKMKETDELISMDVVSGTDNNGYVLSISKRGFGKMTKLDQYTPQGRGGQGVFTFKANTKTGSLVVTRVVYKLDTEIVVISEQGQVIRTELKSIPVLLQRQTSGVKIMNVHQDDSVAALALL